jgi:hypothetical protein
VALYFLPQSWGRIEVGVERGSARCLFFGASSFWFFRNAPATVFLH